LGFVFRCLEDQVVGDGQDGEAQAFDIRQDLQLFLIAERTFRRVNDFAEIHGVEIFGCSGLLQVPEQARNFFGARLLLKKLQESVAVE
jgi:hypothetical protein